MHIVLNVMYDLNPYEGEEEYKETETVIHLNAFGPQVLMGKSLIDLMKRGFRLTLCTPSKQIPLFQHLHCHKTFLKLYRISLFPFVLQTIG
jgi:hypothetical protein